MVYCFRGLAGVGDGKGNSWSDFDVHCEEIGLYLLLQ